MGIISNHVNKMQISQTKMNFLPKILNQKRITKPVDPIERLMMNSLILVILVQPPNPYQPSQKPYDSTRLLYLLIFQSLIQLNNTNYQPKQVMNSNQPSQNYNRKRPREEYKQQNHQDYTNQQYQNNQNYTN